MTGSDGEAVRLGHPGWRGNPLARGVFALSLVALVPSIAGAFGVAEADGGWLAVLAWAMVVTGLLVIVLGGGLLVAVWWSARPATLSGAGVRIPRWRGTRTVPWSAVARCEVRTAEGGSHRLLAAWIGTSADEEIVWLGDVARAQFPEDKVLSLVATWTGSAV